mmetsp:Transcript_33232/g.61149  ORF Transcript_33232/g.61149 Transcript_33232/m.61149 type:complete len:502 (+) Transcript_33232:114-1619(+)
MPSASLWSLPILNRSKSMDINEKHASFLGNVPDNPIVPGSLRRCVSVPCEQILARDMNPTCEDGILVVDSDSKAEAEIAMSSCQICLEDMPASLVDSCGRLECKGAFCHSCLSSYFTERVSASRFALSPVTCAGCRQRVPTDSWRRFVSESTFEKYVQNTKDLLALRCPSCDDIDSLWQECYEYHLERHMERFLARCRDAAAVSQAWSLFEEGQSGADDFLNILLRNGPVDLQDLEPELRVAENGRTYSQQQFIEYYDEKEEYHYDDAAALGPSQEECLVCGCSSEVDEVGDRVCWCDACHLTGCTHGDKSEEFSCHDEAQAEPPQDDENCKSEDTIEESWIPHPKGCGRGLELWKNSTVWSPSKRRDTDGRLYSLVQLEVWYGQQWGRQVWEDMPITMANFNEILWLFKDVERRTTLHLAYLRRWPRIRTPCYCQQDYCFRCQMAWHEGESCEEVMKSTTVDVQFCPGCNVPTVRTEGCSSMVCLCGENWHWDGDDYDDY